MPCARSATRTGSARWGGEEPLALHCPLADATQLAEALRATIATKPILTSDDGIRITSSVGVTDYQPGDTTDSMPSHADTALYRAKRDGRIRVRIAGAVMGSAEAEPVEVG